MPEETVLNDCVGLHLGAGPYFLVYSRALSEEEENVRAHWLEGVKVSVPSMDPVRRADVAG